MKSYFLGVGLLPLVIASHVNAAEQHNAHQHGVVELFLAQDAKNVTIEIHAPASDILGFEHNPTNAEESNKLVNGMQLLSDASNLIFFNQSAKCRLLQEEVSTNLDNGDGAPQKTEHADHEHEHDHEHENDGHGEFTANYTFICDAPLELKEIGTNWFNAFAATESIRVKAALDAKVVEGKLTPKMYQFKF